MESKEDKKPKEKGKPEEKMVGLNMEELDGISDRIVKQGTVQEFEKFQTDLFSVFDMMPTMERMARFWNANKAVVVHMMKDAKEYKRNEEAEPATEPNAEPKEETNEEPKEETTAEPKEETNEEPKEETNEEPKVEPNAEPKEEPKEEPTEETKAEEDKKEGGKTRGKSKMKKYHYGRKTSRRRKRI